MPEETALPQQGPEHSSSCRFSFWVGAEVGGFQAVVLQLFSANSSLFSCPLQSTRRPQPRMLTVASLCLASVGKEEAVGALNWALPSPAALVRFSPFFSFWRLLLAWPQGSAGH